MGAAPSAPPSFMPPPGTRPLMLPPQQPAQQPPQQLTWNPAQRQPQRPAPIIRAQSDDDAPAPARQPEPRRSSLAMPSPEEMGLGMRSTPAEPSHVDWTAAHARLQQLGASSFQIDRRSSGEWHICCLLTNSASAKCRRIEATAGTDGEAVQAVLEQAEKWVHGKPTE